MSYTILYDKQFVSLEDGRFLPMGIIGDSNLWTGDRPDKRVRSWNAVPLDGCEIADSLDNIKKVLEDNRREWIEEKGYSEENLGWKIALDIGNKGTNNTTYGNYKGFYLTGIKKALSVETLRNEGVGLSVSAGWQEGLKDKLEAHGLPFLSKAFYSTQELISFIDNEYSKYRSAGIYVNFKFNTNEYDTYELKHIRKRRFPVSRANSVKKEGEYFLISISGHGYVKRMNSRSLKTTTTKQLAQHIKSKKALDKKIEKLKEGYSLKFNIETVSYLKEEFSSSSEQQIGINF